MRIPIRLARLARTLLPAAALALGAALPAATLHAQGEAGYRVVVNEKNGISEMSREQLSRLFLKKTTSWSNGQTVAIVDRVEASDVRERFTADVHQRQVRAVKRYWQQMIFGGRAVPPPEKASDDEVLAYVRSNPNAIGYVAADAPIGPGVKVVAVK